MGLVKYRGSLYPGRHEAIVPKGLWERALEVRGAHARAPRAYVPPVRVYLLSGLGRCAHCGRTLRAQGGRGRYAYYREMSAERGYDDCPMADRGIRMDEAEEQLGWLMMGFALPAEWQEEIRAALEDEEARAAVEAERARLTYPVRAYGPWILLLTAFGLLMSPSGRCPEVLPLSSSSSIWGVVAASGNASRNRSGRPM